MIGELIAGRYELVEAIGRGGMSDVYKARDRVLERFVTLKVLRPSLGRESEFVERFRREARAVARLSHPNIVTVIDRGESDGSEFIAFEFIEGEDLKQMLDRDGPFEPRRAIEIVIAAASGLAFVHDKGFVHRDVKPQNILITLRGEVKLTDFGIARSLESASGMTQTGTLLGTSAYLSPEQASGRKATASADIYSLGVVAYELVTAEVPFSGDDRPGGGAATPERLGAEAADAPPRPAEAVCSGGRSCARQGPRRPFRIDERIRGRATSLPRHARRCRLRAHAREHALATTRPTSTGRARKRTGRRSRWAPSAPTPAVACGGCTARRRRGRPRRARASRFGHGTARGAAGGAVGVGSLVPLRAIGDYNPSSHPDTLAATAPLATGSGPPGWHTQIYYTPEFGNLLRGLGLLVDTGDPTTLTQISFRTSTPGFVARILAGDLPSGPFRTDSALKAVGATTTFALDRVTARYYVLWVTRLPDAVHEAEVNDLTGRS